MQSTPSTKLYRLRRIVLATALVAGISGASMMASIPQASATAETPPTTSGLSTGFLSFTATTGGASGVEFVIVTNNSKKGAGPLKFNNPIVTLSGPDASNFTIVHQADGSIAPCSASTSLAVGKSCAIGIEFLAGSLKSYSSAYASLTIDDNGSNSECVFLCAFVCPPDLPESCVDVSNPVEDPTLFFQSPNTGVSQTEYVVITNCSEKGGPDLTFNDPMATLTQPEGSPSKPPFAPVFGFATPRPYDGPSSPESPCDNAEGCAPCNIETPLLPGQSCDISLVFFGDNAYALDGNGDYFGTITINDNGYNTECANLEGYAYSATAMGPAEFVTPDSEVGSCEPPLT